LDQLTHKFLPLQTTHLTVVLFAIKVRCSLIPKSQQEVKN